EIAWQALNLAICRIAEPEIKPGKVVVRGKLVA
ncbi:LacI family transcriptional regulator, partial [Serratia marcescens]